jgi:UDP-N-acetylglucosamine acyltransferase
MSHSGSIHPTAIVSPSVKLGSNVQIGPYAVLDGNITIGDDCIIKAGAYLYGSITMGKRNTVYTGAVLGEQPQHLKYAGEETSLLIGDDNIFREHVTIHRGTTATYKTVIGSRNFLMAGSHIAHDCVIGNGCILANGALVGGHCVLEDNVYLAGHASVHQFVRIGRLALISGLSGTSKDVPPFILQQNINNVCGVNVIGMRRAGMTPLQISAVREAFRILFMEALLLPVAMDRLEKHLGHIDAIQEMLAFLRNCHKGINQKRDRYSREEVAA